MDRNLRLYPAYQFFLNLLFWVPVFFLYFASRLSIDEVLLVESIYYGGVVVLEVPSGWFSDRVGRRITLLIASAALAAGYALFTQAQDLPAFALAQGFVAVGIAFNSGTDSSLLYDSLLAVGRAQEVATREASAARLSFMGYGVAALLGGASAGFDLRIAYALSALGAAGAFGCALAFREPPRSDGDARPPRPPPPPRLLEAARLLRRPALRWLLVFSVSMVIFEHVPFTFFQPYLDLLFGAEHGGYRLTPLLSGALVCAMMVLSALAAGRAVSLRDRFGSPTVLVGSLALYVVINGAMGAALHPAVLALIALRSVPMALAGPVLSAQLHPRIPTRVRATYLSLQSLAGRLAFATTLASSAAFVGPLDTLDAPTLHALLLAFAAMNAAAVLLLVVGARAVR